MELLHAVNGIFWGWLVAGTLLGTGVFFAFRLAVPQFRSFTSLFGNLIDSMKAKDGISGFSALCAALGGQVGTGSLVGVATALASGGPGAIFWMWMTAVLGMAISFSEAVLAILFRESNGDGTFRGGPAYYMTRGMNCKPLAALFSISIIIGIGCFYVMIQSNSISLAAKGLFGIPSLAAGCGLVILVALIIFGGLKRLAEVSSYLVPFMALAYILIALFVIITHIDQIPALFALILKSAFNFDSAAGGVAGHTIQQAFRYGVARGLFSNDAGNGTAPGMHATANVRHPVNQGFAAMFGTFFTTIIVCSCTAFCILLTGALDGGQTGIELTQTAFHIAIGGFGKYVVFGAMFLFGFTTLLADIYYGEVNIQWFINSPRVIRGYRLFCCALVVISTVVPVANLWEMVDFASAFLVFFNVIALIALSRYVVFALRDYEQQKKNGVSAPEWDFDADVTKRLT